ncbi:MAG: hypothetical protein LBT50_09795 [Prevotellaceae bacterium]|jgi:tetratricopeptide (TPR) repeat protein|nr:hypothetical protein [Prevotellaceae bacterium]
MVWIIFVAIIIIILLIIVLSEKPNNNLVPAKELSVEDFDKLSDSDKISKFLELNEEVGRDIEECQELLNEIKYNSFRESTELYSEILNCENLKKTCELNDRGINLEKRGLINEAIEAYEENISLNYPATHSYDRLMILYRKKKLYNDELRVIQLAICVFMKENERRAETAIRNGIDSDRIFLALETNESIKDENGRYVFVQYNVIKYISRLEKLNRLLINN